MLYSCDRKEEPDKRDEKREEKRCGPQKCHPKEEEKKRPSGCEVCRDIRPCCCSRENSIQVNCPDLLRWALWSSGFFRCNKCEQSGWRRRRGGSGFC